MILEVISICVVPVIVRYKLSDRIIRTYAILDTCSQGTFAQENLLGDLGIPGRKTAITVKNMIEKSQKHQMYWTI